MEQGATALLNDTFHGGGTERVLSYLSSSLFGRQDGVVFLFDDSRIDFDYSGRLVGLHVKAPPYGGTFEEVRSLLTGLLRLRRAKKRHGVGLCISQKEGPNFINVLSGDSKTIVTVHEHKSSGIRFGGWKRLLVRFMIRTLYNKAGCVVAVSQEIARDLAANFGVSHGKLRVIYNPCDVDTIAQRAREPLDSQHAALFGGSTVITVGRLVTQKGHWHLIRAFKQVKEYVADARLVILGSGDHADYLQRLAAQLGLHDSVHFLGYQENPFKFIGRADVFALTSLWEGFPAILMEAMACEVPVVSTDCPSGPRELLAPDGIVKPGCRAAELASYGIMTPRVDGQYKSADDPLTDEEAKVGSAIVRLLREPQLRQRYAAAGLARVRQFSLDRYAAEWRSLIESL